MSAKRLHQYANRYLDECVQSCSTYSPHEVFWLSKKFEMLRISDNLLDESASSNGRFGYSAKHYGSYWKWIKDCTPDEFYKAAFKDSELGQEFYISYDCDYHCIFFPELYSDYKFLTSYVGLALAIDAFRRYGIDVFYIYEHFDDLCKIKSTGSLMKAKPCSDYSCFSHHEKLEDNIRVLDVAPQDMDLESECIHSTDGGVPDLDSEAVMMDYEDSSTVRVLRDSIDFLPHQSDRELVLSISCDDMCDYERPSSDVISTISSGVHDVIVTVAAVRDSPMPVKTDAAIPAMTTVLLDINSSDLDPISLVPLTTVERGKLSYLVLKHRKVIKKYYGQHQLRRLKAKIDARTRVVKRKRLKMYSDDHLKMIEYSRRTRTRMKKW